MKWRDVFMTNELNLTVLTNNGERVLTTKQLAECYGTEENNIVKNFSNNKDRFIEGKHYYLLVGEELRNFKHEVNDIHVVANNVNKLYIWTEKGASRMCKILDTDKAWEQFDILEETYFNVKNKLDLFGNLTLEQYMSLEEEDRGIAFFNKQKQNKLLLKQVEENQEKANKFDVFLNADGLCKIGDFAKMIGMGRNKLYEKLRDAKILMDDNIPYQKYMKYFVVKNTVKYNRRFKVVLINEKGLDYLTTKLKVA